jgi:transposase
MRLKDEDLKEIAKLVDKGYGSIKIASMYNYSSGGMRKIINRYKMHGIESILHGKSKSFTIDEKIAIINRYYAGESKNSLALELNVNTSVVNSWIKKYEESGYNGLIDNRGRPGKTKMGRPKKKQDNTSTTVMTQVSDEEREELNRLRKENYHLKMEIDCLKKIQALVQERQNRQMKKKQKP